MLLLNAPMPQRLHIGLFVMIDAPEEPLHGNSTLFLAGSVLDTGANLLVDTGATHNVIDTNFARLIDLMEQRIRTTILFGSTGEVTC